MAKSQSVYLLYGYNVETTSALKRKEGVLINLQHKGNSAEDYEALYREYANYLGTDWLSVDLCSLWSHDTILHIPFNYDLCSQGGYFTLYFFDKVEPAMVKRYKSLLRNEHDVVTVGEVYIELIDWQSSNPVFQTVQRPDWLSPNPSFLISKDESLQPQV